MSLRQNALALVVLTVLMAIAGDWSGDPDFARLWYLALALLLLAPFAWTLVDRDRRGLHDLLAGTRLAHVAPPAAMRSVDV